jgi:hypothetical protein
MLDLLGIAILIVIEHGDARLIDGAVGTCNRPWIASQHPVVPALPVAVVSPGTNPAKLVTQGFVEAKNATIVSSTTASVPSAVV